MVAPTGAADFDSKDSGDGDVVSVGAGDR